MLSPSLPSHDEPGGHRVPAGLPPVVDAHVHVFPENMFRAIWKWFDEHAWRIRYRMNTREIFDFLLSRGVRHVVALQYAHRPGIAGDLNRYLAGELRGYGGRVTGLATVYPGEPGAGEILDTAFGLGLRGVKLHVHVQCFDMNGPGAERVYQACADNGLPLVIHAGREPKSAAYRCDPHELCSAERLERVVRNFPSLKLCVPHLGMDEIDRYRELVEIYDTLWLDTTMALADYFPGHTPPPLEGYRPDRVMYGSDFPNIPFAWDRELKKIESSGLPGSFLELLMEKNAREFFGI